MLRAVMTELDNNKTIWLENGALFDVNDEGILKLYNSNIDSLLAEYKDVEPKWNWKVVFDNLDQVLDECYKNRDVEILSYYDNDNLIDKELDEHYRVCDICGAKHSAGYHCQDDCTYYCSDECLKIEMDTVYGEGNWWWNNYDTEGCQSVLNPNERFMTVRDKDGTLDELDMFYTEWF